MHTEERGDNTGVYGHHGLSLSNNKKLRKQIFVSVSKCYVPPGFDHPDDQPLAIVPTFEAPPSLPRKRCGRREVLVVDRIEDVGNPQAVPAQVMNLSMS